jgi:hypothetical protein
MGLLCKFWFNQFSTLPLAASPPESIRRGGLLWESKTALNAS